MGRSRQNKPAKDVGHGGRQSGHSTRRRVVVEVALDETGPHSVDPNADGGDFLGEPDRQRIDGALGCRVVDPLARAAERLRIRRTTLVEKMRKYGMSRRDGDEQADD